MVARSQLRGHQIYWDGELWRYCDNDAPTISEWRTRPCGSCGLYSTEDGHDPCLGTLPGVTNACCGHGDPEHSYVQFESGVTIRGFNSVEHAEPEQDSSAE